MSDATELTLFKIEEPAPGYWRITYANPPINMLNSKTILELAEIGRASCRERVSCCV